MPPPRYAHVQEDSASPGPDNDLQDILVIHDIMDTLDQIPPELTRVHSDLNELGAVLYATLVNLETKLHQLIDWIQDPEIEPAKRFQLLQEIAEEAARYKLGGDDKIRVAGGACDGLITHQRHISNLLAASTLLRQDPPSPYTQSLILTQAPVYTSNRRQVARAVNSPFGGPARGAAVGDTPTKKKKNRIQAIGADDDMSSVAGDKKKAPSKKRKPTNRAASPADSLGSTSAFASSRPAQPQTARQLAAAANKAKKAERADDSEDESEEDEKDGGLGLETGSREGSNIPGKPAEANAIRRRSHKRSREDDEGQSESEEEAEGAKPSALSRKGQLDFLHSNADTPQSDPVEGEPEERAYCICGQVSYGEMIGCDDDECEIEWYHLMCLGLDKTPEGNWICPQCKERRKRNPKKKVSKPKAKK